MLRSRNFPNFVIPAPMIATSLIVSSLTVA